MAGVIRKKNPGDAWETVLDTGSGGSQPTDTNLEFTNFDVTSDHGVIASITGNGGGVDFVTVAGDLTANVPFAAQLLAAGGVYYVHIDGTDPDVDGFYGITDATYDEGEDETTVTFNDHPADPPVGGVVIFPAVTRYNVTIPEEGSVEWVYVEVTEVFSDIEGAYFWIGDEDGIDTFIPVGHSGNEAYLLGNSGAYQWPMLTLDPDATVIDFAEATAIKRYPAGGQVHAIFTQGLLGGVTGALLATVHHHFGEVGVAVLEPISD